MVRRAIALMCIALGVSTATEVTPIPFILMGVGLLLMVFEVTE